MLLAKYVLMRKDREDTKGNHLYSILCINEEGQRTPRVILYILLYVLMKKETEDAKGHPLYSIICINEEGNRGHQGSSFTFCYMY